MDIHLRERDRMQAYVTQKPLYDENKKIRDLKEKNIFYIYVPDLIKLSETYNLNNQGMTKNSKRMRNNEYR